MHSVFLSYAREDRARAKAVAAALEKAGVSVWWDHRLAAGSEYSREIEQALEDAEAVVVLWSRAAIESPWVRDEAGKGRDSGRLIPASLDGIEAPLGFGQFHTIDLSGRRWKQGPLKELVEATEEKLAKQGVARTARAPAQRPGVRAAFRPVAIAVGFLAAAAALYLVGIPDFASSGGDDSTGGKVAIAGFTPVSNDPESRRIAQLADGAVERTLSTNFIDTVSSRSASAEAMADADFRLHGTVDRADREVTILASVVEPVSGRTLWSTEVSRDPAESRELTEELAIFLADVIRCSTYTKRRMPEYDSPEVHSRIFRSCEAERSGGRQYDQLPAVSKALIDVAPQSAQAWAYFANGTAFNYPDRRQEVYAAAKKALELDPDNGAVRWALAIVPDPNVSLAQRESLLRQGLSLDPEFLWFRNHLGHLMRKVGRTEEGASFYQEFVSNYPLDHQIRTFTAYMYAQSGRMSEAREEFGRIAQVRPWHRATAIYASRAEIFFGEPDRALRWANSIALPEGERRCIEMAVTALRSNRALGEDEIIRGCKGPIGIVSPVQLLAKFGHTEAVMTQIDRWPEPHLATQGHYVVFEPDFAPLRADPRFIRWLARFGIPQYWLETDKWPDFCRKEKLPYDCREAALAAVKAAR